MTERVTDEQIGALSIHFSPNALPAGKKNKERQQEFKYETLGQFFKDTNHIEMHKPQSWFAFRAGESELSDITINVDHLTGTELSETLVHELEHYIQTTDEAMQNDVEVYDKWRMKLLKRRLADSALRSIVAFGGVAMASQFGSEALDSGLTAFDATTGDIASIAFSVATIGAYFTVSRFMSRELDEKGDAHNRESYVHRPSEVAARYAEEEYPLKLVTLESIPVICETFDDVVERSLGSMTRRMANGSAAQPQTSSSHLK